MELIEDERSYDTFQIHMLKEIVKDIKEELESAGVASDSVEGHTGNIAFRVAAIIDASRIMESDGKPVLPFLCFARDDSLKEIVSSGGGSWMHEYVFGVVDEVFES